MSARNLNETNYDNLSSHGGRMPITQKPMSGWSIDATQNMGFLGNALEKLLTT